MTALQGGGPDDALVVCALDRRDLGRAVPCLVRAFWDYPDTVHLLPDERARARVLPSFLRSDIADSTDFDSLLTVESGGEIIGAAAWMPPGSSPVPMRRQVRQGLALARTIPWALRALPEAARGHKVLHKHHARVGPHYYLRTIGVDPRHQGRGIGVALLQPILQRADAEHVGCYLTTGTPDNVSWYTRFGFNVVTSFRLTPTWPNVWSMWRAPAHA